jgi:hypothetical protein
LNEPLITVLHIKQEVIYRTKRSKINIRAMAVRSLSLLFLQTVTAAPTLFARDGVVSCPSYNGAVIMKGGKSFSIECGKDTYQGDMAAPNGQSFATFEECIQACVDRSGCQAVAYMGRGCYLKGSIPRRVDKSSVWGAVLVSKSESGGSVVAAAPSAAASVVQASAAAASVAAPSAAASVVAPVDGSIKAPVVQSYAAASVKASAVATAKASSVPTTTPSSGSSGSCARPAAKTLSTKRGVPYNDAGMVTAFAGKISWAYNWGSAPDGTMPSGVTYIPMLWSVSNGGTAWNAAATAAIAAGADTLLGFNEPDLAEQANMSIDAAVKGWNSLMEPLKCQARLAAPAVTNGGSPMGLTYLKGFLAACTGCTIDVVPIHWYDSATNIAYFKQYVSDAYTAGGNRPIWITEFGASGTDAQIATFFQTVSSLLISIPQTQI